MDAKVGLSDLEATRLCAEAMGYTAREWTHMVPVPSPTSIAVYNREWPHPFGFDPLTDDAQAMALVKRFNMGIGQDSEGRWSAVMQKPTYCQSFHHATLNAAIVHCVAALQRERGK